MPAPHPPAFRQRAVEIHFPVGGRPQPVGPPAERLYDIGHWPEFERGGHFAAMEVPDLLAEDVRDFFLTRIKSDDRAATR